VKLSVVVPIYNAEAYLEECLNSLIVDNKDIEYILINDGSKDKTWSIISMLHKENPLFQGILLSRNRGHQNALLAGLMTVKSYCDMIISMDADLQDDINAIDEMIGEYKLEKDV